MPRIIDTIPTDPLPIWRCVCARAAKGRSSGSPESKVTTISACRLGPRSTLTAPSSTLMHFFAPVSLLRADLSSGNMSAMRGRSLLWGLAAVLLAAFVQPAAGQAPVDKSALVRFHSPSLGDAGAKVQIVEFFDPACEACRAFYPLVKQLLEEHRGRVRLTIRYVAFHRGADQVVKLLEAARRQGKFAQTLDVIVETQPQWAINHVARLDLALKAVQPVGLQMDKLKADMTAPELDQLIKQDMRDAGTLKISGTPEFFVNGKPLAKLGFDELRSAVLQAVREFYGTAETKKR